MKQATFIYALVIVGLIALLGCSGGSSKGPTKPDDGELTLDYCRVVEIDNQMHVQWKANRITTGVIRYGRSTLSQSLSVPARADSHDILLFPLEYNKSYIYRLTASDTLSNSKEYNGQFTTPLKAVPQPVISPFTISAITESGALLSWTTDEPATTILKYGIGAITDSTTDTAHTMTHEVGLSNLYFSSLYNIRAEAVDVDRLRGIGQDSSFSTITRMMLWFSNTSVTIGDTATIAINLSDALDLAALQYRLVFNSSFVEILSLDQGSFYTEHGGFAFFQEIQPNRLELVNHMSWNIEFTGNEQTGTSADGDGTIAIVKLRGIGVGTVQASFNPDSSFGLDMYETTRSCSLRAGSVEILPL